MLDLYNNEVNNIDYSAISRTAVGRLLSHCCRILALSPYVINIKLFTDLLSPELYYFSSLHFVSRLGQIKQIKIKKVKSKQILENVSLSLYVKMHIYLRNIAVYAKIVF